MKIVSEAKFHTPDSLKLKTGDINASPLSLHMLFLIPLFLFIWHALPSPPPYYVTPLSNTTCALCASTHLLRGCVPAPGHPGVLPADGREGRRRGGDEEAPQSSRVGVALRAPNYNPRLLQRLACLDASSLTESDDALPITPPPPPLLSRGVNLQRGSSSD